MARVDVPVVTTSRFQAVKETPVAGDVANGMQVVNDGSTMIWVANAAVATQTIGFLIVETVDFQAAGPLVVNIPASTTSTLVGPFPLNLYGNVLEFDVSSASLSFLAFTLL